MTEVLRDRLFYFDTDIEVLTGDRIALTSLVFRRSKLGTVCCVPDRGGRALAAEGKDPEDWLIRFDDGRMTGWIYSPEDLQPTKRLRFIARRGADFKPITNSEFDELERREEENVGWIEMALLAIFKLALLFAVVAGILFLVRGCA